MKQKFFDIKLLQADWQIFSLLITVAAYIITVTGVSNNNKIIVLVCSLIIFGIIYIYLYVYYKFVITSLNFKIGKTDVKIKFGDIFKSKGLKVISVNEYFDTIVDDKIICNNSLHGMYVKNYLKYGELKNLDNQIENELNDYRYEENINRVRGKKKKYEIGTTILIEDFILTALTKFNNDNEAYLSMQEYLIFLNKFWNEIAKIHNARTINIPIMGSGISTITPTLSEQEGLEQIIWSLKTSNLIASKSNINILIYKSDKNNISLLRVKEIFKKYK